MEAAAPANALEATAAAATGTLPHSPKPTDRHTTPLIPAAGSDKLHAPHTERNRSVLLEQLRSLGLGVEPNSHTRLLEIASGTGEHAAYFVAHLPHLVLQPTDVDAPALRSIAAHATDLDAATRHRLLPPTYLDAATGQLPRDIPFASFDAVLSCNMVHIAPPACTPGLVAIAAAALKPSGCLIIYGPFLVNGAPTTESNAKFDATLRRMDSSYGLKDVAEIAALAAAAGLRPEATLDLPANNLLLVFRRPAEGA